MASPAPVRDSSLRDLPRIFLGTAIFSGLRFTIVTAADADVVG